MIIIWLSHADDTLVYLFKSKLVWNFSKISPSFVKQHTFDSDHFDNFYLFLTASDILKLKFHKKKVKKKTERKVRNRKVKNFYGRHMFSKSGKGLLRSPDINDKLY